MTGEVSDSPERGGEVVSIAGALGLMLGPAVALGLGRFAYALVLPAMRTQLGWSFATAGALNTANALGYLAGASLAALLARRNGARRSFELSTVATALTLLSTAGTGNLVVLLVLRVLSGVSGAICFVLGAGLIAQAGTNTSSSRSTLLLAVYFAGGGVGIVVSGLIVPAALGAGNWRAAWLALGTVALLCLAAAIPSARTLPATAHPSAPAVQPGRPGLRPLAPLLSCYGLFGAGYIAYMTFIVAALRNQGAGNVEITVFWTVLGACATAAAFVWARLLDRLKPGTGLAIVLAILTLGAVLPVLATGTVAAMSSAVLFGCSFLTVVTAVTNAAQRILPPHQWTAAIALLTTAFAAGQCVGPVLSGIVSDRGSGVQLGLAVGCGMLLLAVLLALLHRSSGQDPPHSGPA